MQTAGLALTDGLALAALVSQSPMLADCGGGAHVANASAAKRQHARAHLGRAPAQPLSGELQHFDGVRFQTHPSLRNFVVASSFSQCSNGFHNNDLTHLL